MRGVSPECMPNLYPKTVNWDIYRHNEGARPKYAAWYFWMLAYMRFKLLRMVKWKPTLKHLYLLLRHIKGAATDAGRGLTLRLFPSLFYKYGAAPDSLASPFQPRASFLDCKPHDAASCAPLGEKNGRSERKKDAFVMMKDHSAEEAA